MTRPGRRVVAALLPDLQVLDRLRRGAGRLPAATPNTRTNIVDFRGCDSSIILIIRGGILRPIGDFPESLSQAMLAGCNLSREIGREPHAEPTISVEGSGPSQGAGGRPSRGGVRGGRYTPGAPARHPAGARVRYAQSSS